MLSAHFLRFLPKNFKKHSQVGVIFYGLRKFPGTTKLGLVFFLKFLGKNLKKWADNTEVLWILQLFIPQTWKSVHNSRLQMFRTTFMDLKNFPKNFPRDHKKQFPALCSDPVLFFPMTIWLKNWVLLNNWRTLYWKPSFSGLVKKLISLILVGY